MKRLANNEFNICTLFLSFLHHSSSHACLCISSFVFPLSLSLSLPQIISSLKTALGSIWVNDINVLKPLVSVGVFAGLITDQLGKCNKGVKTGSHKHRLLFSSQKTYNKVCMLRLVIN